METAKVEEAVLVAPPHKEMEAIYVSHARKYEKISPTSTALGRTRYPIQYIPFANKLTELAQGFQEKAIVALVEEHMNTYEQMYD